MRQPLMLTETIVDRWPARKQFTTKFLANKIRHVKAHIQEDARSFITFHDNKPLEDYVPEQWENFNLKVNTTIPTVLQWGEEGTDPSKGPFLYYTQDMATMRQFPNVIGYIQPVQDLFLSDKNVQVNLWVGREGIVTHAHYDCTYNFFFQLQGRKRFTLYPPSDHLYLYPCLHPHYGHSQVDILNPDNKKFPLFKSARPVVAEVRPGDMLVVPPFWFHHVETLEESVSVNVWSDAPEYDLINQVYSLPIPFEDSWSTEEKVVATKIYISMILSHFEIQYIEFLQHLLEQRYEILIRDERLRFNSSVSDQVVHTCTSDQKWNQHHTVYEPFLREGVDATVLLLQKISMRSILKVCIGNFIEHLIHRVLSLDNIFSFLKHCSV
ncbi:HSPB1-associated protein 1-like isoform X2 [Halichondria panicea]